MKKAFNFFLLIFAIIFLVGDCLAIELDFEEPEGVQTHGFVSQGGLYTNRYNFMADTEGGTAQFGEMGINFTTDLTDAMRIGVQFVARDLGDIGDYEPYVDWASADYRFRSWLGIRGGLIKMPYGLYNETRDADMLRTSILLPTGVYIESFRDAYNSLEGVGAYGNIPLSIAGDLAYQLNYGAINIDPNGGTGKMFQNAMGTTIEKFDFDDIYNGSVQWTLPFGLRLGTTFQYMNWVATSDTPIDIMHYGAALDATGNYILQDKYGNDITQKYDAQGNPETIDVAGTTLPTYDKEGTTVFPTSEPDASGNMTFGDTQGNTIAAGPKVENKYTTQRKPELVVKNALMYTVSAEYMLGDMILAAEYWDLAYDYHLRIPLEDMTNPYIQGINQLKDMRLEEVREFEVYGYYVSAAYRINDWMEVGSSYSWITNDAFDKDAKVASQQPGNTDYSKSLEDITLSMRFDINEFWLFKLEGHKMKGHAYVLNTDNPVKESVYPYGPENNDLPVANDISENSLKYPEKDWYMFGVKMSYSF